MSLNKDSTGALRKTAIHGMSSITQGVSMGHTILEQVNGILRKDESSSRNAMQKFTTKMDQMMKDEKLFESQGGPIILSQAFGAAGHAYLTRAVKMVVGLNTGVPRVTASKNAPDPIVCTFYS
ncbi:glycoside hydrolase, family 35 [Artemisia annua]|uniref:Glycoside hydrolase, family 35 n=1 Tax=Artemisia annua TaxID=35608 RepID=A0A2U1N293_ARTAN|nr:glycoside hydrolase, family 35 [Artemisia annua]